MIDLKRILVPVDFSKFSGNALRYACALAEKFSAEVHLLHVTDPIKPAFWSRLEADRKRPWRMARKGGFGTLLKYLFGRLSLEDALGSLSQAMGCRLGYVLINTPRAAVDVDSVADRDLAVKILHGDLPTIPFQASAPGGPPGGD